MHGINSIKNIFLVVGVSSSAKNGWRKGEREEKTGRTSQEMENCRPENKKWNSSDSTTRERDKKKK
mgnify:CR=1 FL=1